MTDIVTTSNNELDNWDDSGPWYEGTHGERIAVRLCSLDTNGAYAIVESIAAPGCATPMHLHAYVTNLNDNSVSVIDTATNKVVATIPVGTSPYAVVFATVTPVAP